MSVNLYVGNISYQTTEQDLQEVFGKFGELDNVKVIKDRETGRSRGFAFVEMKETSDAEKAIEELDGTMFQNRQLVVNKARPRRERPNRRRF